MLQKELIPKGDCCFGCPLIKERDTLALTFSFAQDKHDRHVSCFLGLLHFIHPLSCAMSNMGLSMRSVRIHI